MVLQWFELLSGSSGCLWGCLVLGGSVSCVGSSWVSLVSVGSRASGTVAYAPYRAFGSAVAVWFASLILSSYVVPWVPVCVWVLLCRWVCLVVPLLDQTVVLCVVL